MQGRPQDALPEIERVGYDPYRTFLYAIAYHALGRKKDADAAVRKLIAKYHTENAYEIAEVYAFPEPVRRSVRVAGPRLLEA